MQKVSFPHLLQKETKTNYYVPFQESQVPADKITQNNNSHAQFYFHKNSRQFLLSNIESQVSGDKITQFNNILVFDTALVYLKTAFSLNEDAWKTEQ